MPKQKAQLHLQPLQPARRSSRLLKQQPRSGTPARSNPLGIPEILALIGSFLDNFSATVCLRVCSDWRRTLLPRVWSEVELQLHSPANCKPSLTSLESHSSLIRKLTIYTFNEQFEYPGGHLWFPDLKELLFRTTWVDATVNERFILAMIQNHQSELKTISFGPVPSEPVLQAIQDCPRLEKLSLHNFAPVSLARWKDRYHHLWSRLRSLSWGAVNTQQSSDTPLTATTLSTLLTTSTRTMIQELDLQTEFCTQSIIQAHLVLIIKSPGLVRLNWMASNARVRDQAMRLLAQAVRTSQHICQRLDSFALSDAEFTNSDLRDILSSFPLLTKLKLRETNFDAGSWRVLSQDLPRYLTQLTELDLSGCDLVDGALVQEIMCLMPTNLKSLRADYISDTDLFRDERPWSCLGLKHLALVFFLEHRERTQPMVVARLAQLTSLETLDLALDNDVLLRHHRQEHISMKPYRVKRHCLRLSLTEAQDNQGQGHGHGPGRGGGGDLERLAGLQNLKRLMGPGSFETVWEEAEARWVLEHWVRMEKVDGFRLDDSADRILQSRMQVTPYGYPTR